MRYIAVFLIVTLMGCAYKPPINQGQYIEPSQIKRIEKGMNPNQVVAVLGTPLLIHQNQSVEWIYPYYYEGSTKVDKQNYIIRFDQFNRVSDVIYNGNQIR